MHNETIAKWQHTHIFGQDQIKSGERRTLFVIIITGLMMVAEIVAGIVFGSMALTADGIHMGSHMVGLGITFLAYIYARKYANDQRFSFGTGKVNALAGYSSAMILVFIALFMGYESVVRIIAPVKIQYNQAIIVAVIGLVVNGVSMLILGEKGHTHANGDQTHGNHDHGAHDHAGHDHDEHDHDHVDHDHTHVGTGDDHNLKAAYLHVLADAMTSVLAIIALLAAKYFTLVWMDPVMGIVGAIMVIRWSVGLIQGTSKVLLDHQGPIEVQKRITGILESYKDTKVCDLHIWSIGPGIYSSEISIVTKYPDSPNKYKTLIPKDAGVIHSTVEVHYCPE
ncbi:cation diffusion facilitator family transporter [Microgenomates group bacterium RBG_16_45_19]|nr:MAG: cation diffusion facilitator family transporter [Microgenomates group bacterium RBG_16_45_19]